MIENSASVLRGQTEIEDFIPSAPVSTQNDGYDHDGNLLDVKKAESDTEARLRQISGEINAITEHARVVLASAAIDIGKRLIEARALVPNGRWREWLQGNVDYSERQAQLMMQLAERYGTGELPEAYRGLGISHMTALLAAPDDEREALAERVKEEDLSVRELRREIEQLKEEQADRQIEMDAISSDLDKANENLNGAMRAMSVQDEELQQARAKAKAAEESAEELRKLHSDAEDRAAKSAQRASDAVNRANQTAKELAEAKIRIKKLEEKEKDVKTVEVIPESVNRELERLRAELEDARAKAQPVTVQAAEGPTAADRFKWFYSNQLKPAFSSAAQLLKEVAAENPETAKMFAMSIEKACGLLTNMTGGN